MFTVGIPVALGLFAVYVALRASSVPFIARRLSRRTALIAAAVLWPLCVVGWRVGRNATGALAGALELFGLTWLGGLFLLSLPLLALDLATGFGRLLRPYAGRLRGCALLVGLALAALAIIQGMRPPAVRSHEVSLAGLPSELDGTVVVAVSDLHLGNLRDARWLTARVEQIHAQRPDLIVVLGDVFEVRVSPPRELLVAMRRLSAPLGVWAVTGNHESHGRRQEPLLEQAGLRVLHGRWAEVRPGLILAGVDDLTALWRAGIREDTVTPALAGRPRGATLFLTHTPWGLDQAARAGVGLTLAGHTHGGQIWPLEYLVRLRYPRVAGQYDHQGMQVIVCRGTGSWGPPMRLWRRSEILRVTLRAAGERVGIRSSRE